MKRKWTILACALLAALIVAVGSDAMQVMMQGTVYVASSGEGGEDPGGGDPGGGDDEHLLSWSAVAGATGYKIYWNSGQIPGPPYANVADVGNVTSATPDGYEPGDSARIRTYDENGYEGPWSEEINQRPCDTTLTSSNSLATPVSGASNGTVICLGEGSYGTENLTSINRTGWVTLRAAPGASVTVTPVVNNSKYIRFQGPMTLAGAGVLSCSQNVQFLSVTFTGSVTMNFRDATCSPDLNILVDGSYFGNLSPGLWEGRLSIGDDDSSTTPLGIHITNNTFDGEGGCASDGVQLVGGASGVTIGPGNVFKNIVQSGPTHCDMIQFYGSGTNNTIIGNWFKDGSVALTHHTEPFSNTTFSHNVISNVNQIQIDQSAGFVFDHNTVYDLSDVFHLHTQSGGDMIARSNIKHSSTSISTTGGSLTASYWLCDSGCLGTNQESGTPSYVGGTPSSISTFAGWKLTGTAGIGNGHDGKDKGTLIRNLPAPSDFAEQSP